jgi:hypothetical protein
MSCFVVCCCVVVAPRCACVYLCVVWSMRMACQLCGLYALKWPIVACGDWEAGSRERDPCALKTLWVYIAGNSPGMLPFIRV